MSQIGYMIMAVSSGAYVAGIFHFYTHAFFKALLFMAAGSVIAAMAGVQNIDQMRGFRKAMPFTFGCFVIGGLSLAGVPPFAGFFSKDEVLAFVADRGGWHIALVVVGYITAFITAVYTFRMIFRVFFGEPSPEASELEQGHLHHADVPRNPVTGEEEDTDVGFPGPEHHIAEQRAADADRDGRARAGRDRRAAGCRSPRSSHALDHFLEPTFAESRFYEELHPTDALTFGGMTLGALLGARRHRRRLPDLDAAARRSPCSCASASARCTRSSSTSGTPTRRSTCLFVRPAAWVGRFAQSTFERLVVNGAVHRRPGRARARRQRRGAQPAERLPARLRRAHAPRHRRRRPLAADPLMTIHLSILLWLPAVTGLLALAGRRAAGWVDARRVAARVRLLGRAARRFRRRRAARCSTSPTSSGSSSSASTTSSASTA